MKMPLAMLCLMIGLTPALGDSANLDRTFRAAATAYDQGQFNEAVQLYQNLLDQGVQSKEVHFNLANALYRTGDAGHAVLAYRRAWMRAPRDSDIQANLQFVMSDAAAVMATPNPVNHFLHQVSLPEWWAAAATAWWLLWFALALAAVSSRFRPPLLRIAAVLTVLVGVSAFGIYRWSGVIQAREVVVTEPHGIQALYAPLPDAEAHFELPAGSILTVREQANAWLKVSIDGRDGWVRETSVTRVQSETDA